MAGKYGPPGGCLLNFRTYPRIPFYEQVHDNEPFFTDTGRMHAYADVPEAIEYGENFIVHREGPEATPYLPNVIVSSNPLVRPEDYGIPANAEHWDERTIRNIKMPWSKVKETNNFLWEKGFQFYCLTPKTRHRVHSGWSNVDWHMLMDSNFGDPYRLDKRAPCVGEHQLHMNPQAARDLEINDGDYVYVDANPADRPYLGAKPGRSVLRVSRLMLRVTYNRAYPYNIVMMKHAPFIATEKSVKAHETRPDGRALSANTVIKPTCATARSSRHAQLAYADAPDRHAVSQERRPSWASFSAAKPTITLSTPCQRKPWCASPRRKTAESAEKASGHRPPPVSRRPTKTM